MNHHTTRKHQEKNFRSTRHLKYLSATVALNINRLQPVRNKNEANNLIYNSFPQRDNQINFQPTCDFTTQEISNKFRSQNSKFKCHMAILYKMVKFQKQ